MRSRALPWALLASCAAVARAQVVARVPVEALPASAAAASVHPALLSPDGAAGAPLAAFLAEGAAGLSAALRAAPPAAPGAAPVAPALAALAASPEPARRAVAGLLARAVGDTRDAAALLVRMPALLNSDLPSLAACRPELGAAAGLADASRGDPTVAFLFDGRAPPRVGLDPDAALDGEDLVAGGRRVAAIGRGFFGIVHPHPSVEGAVVKTDLPRGTDPSAEPASAGAFRLSRDRRTTREAARIGVGPRLLGEATVGDRPALVKERMYGDTVARLLESGRFTAEDHALIEEMFLTVARSGIVFLDVRPENIMLGRTLVDPRRRAYLVDGGEFYAPTRPESAGDRAERLFGDLRALVHPPELLPRFDAVHFTRPRRE